MKTKNAFFFFGILTLLSGLFVFGCDHSLPPDYLPPAMESSAVAKKYNSLINLQIDYAQKGFEAVSHYIDLPALESRSLLYEPIDYADIGALLPADTSGLKRIKPSNARYAIDSEISLEEELVMLVEEFEEKLIAHIPDPSKALTLPYVEESEGGFMIGGDFMPNNSIEGILTIEILNALADGADPEELYKNIPLELENGVIFEDNSRAMVRTKEKDFGRWANGLVRFKWGSISEDHKIAMLIAMATWGRETGKIVLIEHSSSDWWTQWQIDLGVIGVVKIEDAPLIGKSGEATVGTFGGETGLRLKTGITGAELSRTALHEFGHTLGLQHEHQRYDRDTYITVSYTGPAYDIIPHYIEGFRWQYLRVKVGFWTIYIPYPVFWKEEQSRLFGNFDFRSIMIYEGFPIKDTPLARNAGFLPGSRVPYNTTLSPQDISAIRQIY